MMKPSIIILFSFRILRLSCAVQPLTENCKIVATSDTRINIFNDNHEETDIFDENFKHTVFRCDGDGFSYGFELPTAENQHMQQLLDTGGLVINESTLLKKANVIVEGNTIISLGIQPWSFARNEGQERRRSEEGNKPILAVKVTDVNGLADPDTPATIGDNIFGTLGDPVNLKSQMYACSFEKLNIVNEYSVNITDHEAAPGVIEVTISISLKAHDRYAIHDAVTAAVQTKLGFNLPGPFEQVMYVLENCYVGCGWAAYAYINSWMSVYQGGYYAQAGVQMHEIGHNFGFAHSGGLDGQAYTDHTCQMGNPLYGDDLGKMCFNPAKNWAIGWYDSKKTEININTNFINRVETIVGVADFKNNPDNRNVIIKLETGTSNDYFVGFNRAIGVNSQNDEADNEVTIILTGNDGISYSQSYLQATLKQDESWELNGMIITAEEINITSNPGTAKVSIMKGSNPTDSPIRSTELPTSSPTRNPNKQPTPSPTQAPVIIESSPPTKLDSCSETSGARFLMKMKKNNGDIKVKVRSCNWLRKIKKESKRTKICERKVFCYEEYRSAGDTCTETCDTCDPCYENSRSKFYHKTNKRGKVITKRCSWLDTKDNEQVEIACQKSVPTGVCYGSAIEVCPQSCPTPAGAMGCG